MPTLCVRFPAGRYHATPWGHHVNEGLVEWPPSPWRLLRALIATGFTKLGWSSAPAEAKRLVERLAATLPSYRLPLATLAHSRHYMPVGALEKGRERTTLVFDAWAHVGDGVMSVRWDCELDAEAHALFGQLAAHLSYLGRSESWVEAEALDEDTAVVPGVNAVPHKEGETLDPGWELVPLQAPLPPDAYLRWREEMMNQALSRLSSGNGARKPSKAKLAKVAEPFPEDLIEALQRDTAWWKGHRWSQPPGSRRVLYRRPSDALTISPPVTPRRQAPRPVEMVLLSLSTSSGSTSALPTTARVLPQAELLHRALVRKAGNGTKVDCPELTGRDERGRPLQGHQHAHLFPVDLDGDEHIDHVVIYAPMGLRGTAQQAIRQLRRTWMKGGAGELLVAVAGLGSVSELRRLPPHLALRASQIVGPEAGARTWVSETVFVPPRHLKRRGRNSLEGQILAELSCRGYPAAQIEVLPWHASTLRLRHAIRVRRHPAPPPPRDIGVLVRLRFEQPVRGPIALGYACHFGLGLFRAVPDD